MWCWKQNETDVELQIILIPLWYPEYFKKIYTGKYIFKDLEKATQTQAVNLLTHRKKDVKQNKESSLLHSSLCGKVCVWVGGEARVSFAKGANQLTTPPE